MERQLAASGTLNVSRHFDADTNVRLKEGNNRERAVIAHRIFNADELQQMTDIVTRAAEGISLEQGLQLDDRTRGHRLAVGGGHM